MAYTFPQYAKQPRGYEVQHKNILEISQGIHPSINMRVWPYLPVVELQKRFEDYIVLAAGSLVGTIYDEDLDETFLVPSNGGLAVNVAYTSLDVGVTLKNDDGDLVTQADVDGGETIEIPANRVVGYTYYDYYMDVEHINPNYQPQTREKGISCDWFIELPCVNQEQRKAECGQLIIPSRTVKGAWIPVTDDIADLWATEYFAAPATPTTLELMNFYSQICGKIIEVGTVKDYDNLQMETTYPGLGLQGSGTNGIPGHLLAAVDSAGKTVLTTGFEEGEALKIRVQMGAMCS